jgi:alkylation response protein AidB-like acyl-CoA dehydrogenase
MGLWGWPIAAVALGIAQGAIDEIMRVAQRKTPRLSTNTLREQPLFQTQLAQAVALVSSARSWLYEVVTKVWERALHGAEAPLEQRAEFLLAQHIALAPSQYENSGRMLLGLQPDNPFILL